jgi:phosphatidylinositol alpha-1,6-mannosyltransferase
VLILVPSRGFGGGIERVAAAIERAWPGECARVDLYDVRRHRRAEGQLAAKVRFVCTGVREARRFRPRIILVLHAGLLPAAHIMRLHRRSVIALVGHGTEVWARLSPLGIALGRRTDILLSVSAFTAGVLAQNLRVAPAEVGVLPLPVADELLHRSGQSARVPTTPPRLLTVARVTRAHRYKGHFLVAESLPPVLDRFPDVQWHVVGTGDDVPALRARCRELGIAQSVFFAGGVSDARLADFYECAYALVLPSVTNLMARPPEGEGFGLVYAEAAMFGVPSVASEAGGGANEMVTAGVTGLTVRPGDSRDLAAALIELLSDPMLRNSLGARARTRALSRHTSEQFGAVLVGALGCA